MAAETLRGLLLRPRADDVVVEADRTRATAGEQRGRGQALAARAERGCHGGGRGQRWTAGQADGAAVEVGPVEAVVAGRRPGHGQRAARGERTETGAAHPDGEPSHPAAAGHWVSFGSSDEALDARP